MFGVLECLRITLCVCEGVYISVFTYFGNFGQNITHPAKSSHPAFTVQLGDFFS